MRASVARPAQEEERFAIPRASTSLPRVSRQRHMSWPAIDRLMTMSRRVRRIIVSGYKSIKEVELHLGPVTVLVGPNGAGKSNFIEAVELLGRIADGELGMQVGLRGAPWR